MVSDEGPIMMDMDNLDLFSYEYEPSNAVKVPATFELVLDEEDASDDQCLPEDVVECDDIVNIGFAADPSTILTSAPTELNSNDDSVIMLPYSVTLAKKLIRTAPDWVKQTDPNFEESMRTLLAGVETQDLDDYLDGVAKMEADAELCEPPKKAYLKFCANILKALIFAGPEGTGVGYQPISPPSPHIHQQLHISEGSSKSDEQVVDKSSSIGILSPEDRACRRSSPNSSLTLRSLEEGLGCKNSMNEGKFIGSNSVDTGLPPIQVDRSPVYSIDSVGTGAPMEADGEERRNVGGEKYEEELAQNESGEAQELLENQICSENRLLHTKVIKSFGLKVPSTDASKKRLYEDLELLLSDSDTFRNAPSLSAVNAYISEIRIQRALNSHRKIKEMILLHQLVKLKDIMNITGLNDTKERRIKQYLNDHHILFTEYS